MHTIILGSNQVDKTIY